MIVIHSKDSSTKILSLIYDGINDITLFEAWEQRTEILNAISAAPREEPILLLGHGCSNGLFDMNYRLIINDSDAPILKDRPNLAGIWCCASSYAQAHALSGLFSGMFISEEPEAWINGVNADAEEIDEKILDFSRRFGNLLRAGKKLEEIAAELMKPCHRDSDLTRFKYSRLIWRP